MREKMRMNRLFLTTLILLAIPCSLFSAFKDSGWGVRPLGMAGAFTAVANDSNAQLFNPAGLQLVEQEELSLMSAQMYYGLEGVDIGLNYMGYVKPLGKKAGNIGVAWGAMSSPSLYREDTASIGYGRYVNDLFGFSKPNVALGVNIKYLKHEYTLDARTVGDPVFEHGNSAAATTGDAGVIVNWEKIGLTCAVACKNINSPDVGLLSRDKVPNENVLGLAYSKDMMPYLKLPYFTAALDIVSRNSETEARFGMESWFFDGKFAARTGASRQNITAGFGYEIRITEKTKLIIDYALAWPLQIENTSGSHRFGLTVCLP